MAGLDPPIHVLLVAAKTWMPGTSPGMTEMGKTSHDRHRQEARFHRLHRQGYRPRRIRPQGNLAGRNRDARPDGDARGIWPGTAAQGRADRGLAAHDDPDRGPDRDA